MTKASTKNLPRGVQVVQWRNQDGSKAVRYRVRIQRKDYRADSLFETPDEAAEFLANSKSRAGREAIAKESKARIALKAFQMAPTLSYFLGSYKARYGTVDPSFFRLFRRRFGGYFRIPFLGYVFSFLRAEFLCHCRLRLLLLRTKPASQSNGLKQGRLSDIRRVEVGTSKAFATLTIDQKQNRAQDAPVGATQAFQNRVESLALRGFRPSNLGVYRQGVN